MKEMKKYKDSKGLIYIYDDKEAMIEKYEGNDITLELPKFIIIDSISYPVIGIKSEAFIKCPTLRLLIIPNYKIMEHWAIFLELNEHMNIYITRLSKSLPYDWNEYWTNSGQIYYLDDDNQLYIQNEAYFVLKNEEAILSLYLGEQKEYNIPLYIEQNKKQYKVTSIGEYAFLNCKFIEKITIPNNINQVKFGAFIRCIALKEVTFLNDDVDLDQLLFLGCSSLKKVHLPKNLLSIKDSMFESCSSLEYLEIPNKVYYIRDYAFMGCSSLKWLILPSSIEIIDTYCFLFCEKLTLFIDKNKDDINIKSSWNEIKNKKLCPVYWKNEWEIKDGIPQKKE